MNGVDRETAKAALTLAASKLPIATKILVRDDEV
jgi:ribosomal protein L16/L10AE